MSDVEGEDGDSPLQELLARHRKEKKDLQGKIANLKKTAKSGGKKAAKEATEEIAKLEKEMEERHNKERSGVEEKKEPVKAVEKKEEEGEKEDGESDAQFYKEKKVKGKAAKRLEKKAEESKRRGEAAEADAEAAKTSLRTTEMEAVNKELSTRGLHLVDIAPDGDCLYNALAHQLAAKASASSPSGADLRRRAAAYIRGHRNDFLPFLSDENGEPLDEIEFEQYCNKVEQSAASGGQWGGEPELRALSESLERKIEVVQPNCSALSFGEVYSASRPLIITYHRHAYGLGEHYNSTRA